MKNYYVGFMNQKEQEGVTAEDAAKILKAWDSGAKFIFVNGNAYATHQVCMVHKVDRQTERDLCEQKGIDPAHPPRIEDFLSDKKLLT